MTDPMIMNAQIVGIVTQTNVKVVAEAPAQVVVVLYRIVSHSVGLSLQSAAYSQQTLNQILTAVASEAVSMIMAIEDKKGT